MKRRNVILLIAILLLTFTAGCVGNNSVGDDADSISNETAGDTATNDTATNNSMPAGEYIKIRIIVGNETLTATLIDNPSSRNLIEKFPMTLPMEDLYSREMYYSFEEKIPASDARRQGYEVGDISLWTPGNGLVIFYEQNGEIISGLQKVGRIDSGVEIFKETGDIDVTFELIE